MRSDESYSKVFAERVPLEVWPKIVLILKITDDTLDKNRPTGTRANEGFLKKWRQITSFLAVSKLFGKIDFSVKELIGLHDETAISQEISEILKFVRRAGMDTVLEDNWKKKRVFVQLCEEVAQEYSINNADKLDSLSKFSIGYYGRVVVSNEFVQKVNKLLPPQPWKPGLHKTISKQLDCTIEEYFSAVNTLIEEGYWYQQKDGIVYDSSGKVVCFDPERVDPNSLKLKDGLT
jgi:hypothetical protein